MSTTAAAASSSEVTKQSTPKVLMANPPAPPSGAGGPDIEGDGAAAVGEEGGRAALATELEALRQQVAAQGGEIKELKAELEPLKEMDGKVKKLMYALSLAQKLFRTPDGQGGPSKQFAAFSPPVPAPVSVPVPVPLQQTPLTSMAQLTGKVPKKGKKGANNKDKDKAITAAPAAASPAVVAVPAAPATAAAAGGGEQTVTLQLPGGGIVYVPVSTLAGLMKAGRAVEQQQPPQPAVIKKTIAIPASALATAAKQTQQQGGKEQDGEAPLFTFGSKTRAGAGAAAVASPAGKRKATVPFATIVASPQQQAPTTEKKGLGTEELAKVEAMLAALKANSPKMEVAAPVAPTAGPTGAGAEVKGKASATPVAAGPTGAGAAAVEVKAEAKKGKAGKNGKKK